MTRWQDERIAWLPGDHWVFATRPSQAQLRRVRKVRNLLYGFAFGVLVVVVLAFAGLSEVPR